MGLGEPPTERLAAGLQVLLAVGQLLLQEAEGEVGLALLVDELGVVFLDALEALGDELDALLDRLLVSADVGELLLGRRQRVAGGFLVPLELLDEPRTSRWTPSGSPGAPWPRRSGP